MSLGEGRAAPVRGDDLQGLAEAVELVAHVLDLLHELLDKEAHLEIRLFAAQELTSCRSHASKASTASG